MKVFSPVLSAVAALFLIAPLSASADMYQEGDIIVRAGIGVVEPNDDSGPVLAASNGVGVKSDTQLAITGSYMLSKHFGVELLAATPFKHELVGTGGLSGVSIGETKHLPPTISFQYYFPNADLPIHPYIGAGVNYTAFFSEKTDAGLAATLDGALSNPGITSTDIELDNSFGLAFQAGMDIELNENWSLSGAVWYIDIDTEATITTNTAASVKVDVDIDPWVYMAGISYRY
ncbi:OmpW/AlkL family protein [Pelagibaculum spongiae]|uniref:Outer membrane protein OmpW n=1 Tax=Pelagibaculum spongiae TaxID=2080658 RepID=A0A2V1H2Y4_9GAMM|nr:OmpW family outer membrane protein [Pelagibaculum spongiae]PVZ69657.1 hypothetical protein DC094_10165 [Pelagibaculum spongiae]